MFFDQKTRYLELRENGEKIGAGGFVRLECWGRTCRLLIQVSGLGKGEDGEVKVILSGAGKGHALTGLTIHEGRGRLELRDLDCMDVARGGISVAELEEMSIPLSDGKEIYCRIAKAHEGKEGAAQAEAPERALQDETATEGALQDETATGESAQERALQDETATEGALRDESAQEGDPGNAGKNDAKEDLRAQEDQTMQQNAEKDKERKTSEPADAMTLKAGKWEQLDAIYPHVAPFGDQRRYLQISPGDFVILKDRSYGKVNNSFLLHGYFTYKHLILHRLTKNGEIVYYVGVPGRFFDREKEVALLFGFESFEGSTEPVKEGDFGYYMIRVEL